MKTLELAYNIGHKCGRLNMQSKHMIQIAFEFKEYRYIHRCLMGWSDGIEEITNEMLEVRQGNANAG
jgi:hypothetical protein